MILSLPTDIICKISTHLTFKDILALEEALNTMFPDSLFVFVSEYEYGVGFWKEAQSRKNVPNRQPTLREEVLRVETFQKEIQKMGSRRWRRKEFEAYWKYCDSLV